jgi:hypothetical protein
MSPMTSAPGEAAAAPSDRKQKARLRAAACRSRLRMASDALAVMDLLLGMQASVRSVGNTSGEPGK